MYFPEGQGASSLRTRTASPGRCLSSRVIWDKLLLTTEHSPMPIGSHQSQFGDIVTRREHIFMCLSRLCFCFSDSSFFAYAFPLFSSAPVRIPSLPSSVLPKAGAHEQTAVEKILHLELVNTGLGSETLCPQQAFVFSSVRLSIAILL